MSRQLGRISGPLLANNLLRNGVDLAFETDVLYLKVNPVTRLFPGEDYEDPNYPGTSGSLLGSGIGVRTDAVPDGLDLFVNSYIISYQALFENLMWFIKIEISIYLFVVLPLS